MCVTATGIWHSPLDRKTYASRVRVGLRAAFVRLLSRGQPPDLDVDGLVEIALVPLHDGPLVIARLDEAGIAVSGIESFDVATSVRSRMPGNGTYALSSIAGGCPAHLAVGAI